MSSCIPMPLAIVMIHPRTSLSSGVPILPPPLPRSAMLQLRTRNAYQAVLSVFATISMNADGGAESGGCERAYMLSTVAISDISSSKCIDLYTSRL